MLTAKCLQARSPRKRLFEPKPKKRLPKRQPNLSLKRIPKTRRGLKAKNPKTEDPYRISVCNPRKVKTPPESSKSASDFLPAQHHSMTCWHKSKTDDKLDKENPTRKKENPKELRNLKVERGKVRDISK